MGKSKSRKWIVWVLIVAVVLLVIASLVRSKNRPKGEEVEIEKVEMRTIRETVTASGKIFPETEIKISSDVSGEIVELYVAEGDSVKMGQVLARIDPEAIQSQVERGQAAVNNAKASLAMAKANIESSAAQITQIEAQLKNALEIHRRNEQLHKDGVISDADLQASEANVAQLQANLSAAKANKRSSEESARAAQFSVNSAEATLKELRTNLQRTTIFAPADGVVSLLNVEKGERVVGTIQMTGTELMRIANLSTMEVQVEVSENDIIRVGLGDTAEIEVDAYLGRSFKGIVSEIANSAANIATTTSLTSDQVTNFIVKIRMVPESYRDLVKGNKSHPFRPGMSASVDIYTNTVDNALSVPIQAVTTRDYKKKTDESKVAAEEEKIREVVFVVKNDTLALVDVKTGIQDAEYIQITEGLVEGDEVVTGPYSAVSRKLSPGDKFERKMKTPEQKK